MAHVNVVNLRLCTACQQPRIIAREVHVATGPNESLCEACAAVDDLAGLIPRLPQYLVVIFAQAVRGVERTWREVIDLWESLQGTISSDSGPEGTQVTSS